MDEAREFDQLPPEESRARLGKIVDRIDSNEDGYEKLRTYMLPRSFLMEVMLDFWLVWLAVTR